MSRSKPFRFKQFTIHQDRCAMKVGTDSVLLGAWAPVFHNPVSILDIGAGTGLLSLMLAQRSQAEIIDAIEIQDLAFEQCVENFEASQWSDRLYAYHASLQEFVAEVEDQYELIISNPPFHSEVQASAEPSRDLARQNLFLPFPDLLQGVGQLLAPMGIFAVILPHKEVTSFTDLAATEDLHPIKVLAVRGNPEAPVKRSLIAFARGKTNFEYDELIIEMGRHVYTQDYIALTRDFYLKM
ncbi:tRNA1(Val) (adenine(37)-N6)-methyltransferase [Lentiprolixibacter aurantiacus]|uniref:tRNA1(Val) (adenine(37)-N6)-methyltransferase n=1 Tax=Lentiprolixibacter aurantiacus TaxID=2993939 RepID=A0AAE3MJT1_9FLAO|nr:methyltransferase [Lentiprolixibacter aurantiacus]MCX2718931.1 methyltransferase [Lentiprolixibacter aurantiacus]